MVKKLIILGILVLLTGCVSYDKTLTAENGLQYRCQQAGFGIIGVLFTESRYQECVKYANEKGFK